MKKLLIINGPNLNLLGKREPILYGSQSFESFFKLLKSEYAPNELAYCQCNKEGELIETIHKGDDYDAIVLNPGAFSHTSIGVADAVAAIATPVIEVHISNVFSRSVERHHSYVSKYANGIIVGLGLDGYRAAIDQTLRF